MSEFSDSLHLRSEELGEGVALLRRARLPGYVFRPVKGWVSPTMTRSGLSLDRIVAANEGLLVHYAYAEDHV